jgi:hypothetical protein
MQQARSDGLAAKGNDWAAARQAYYESEAAKANNASAERIATTNAQAKAGANGQTTYVNPTKMGQVYAVANNYKVDEPVTYTDEATGNHVSGTANAQALYSSLAYAFGNVIEATKGNPSLELFGPEFDKIIMGDPKGQALAIAKGWNASTVFNMMVKAYQSNGGK